MRPCLAVRSTIGDWHFGHGGGTSGIASKRVWWGLNRLRLPDFGHHSQEGGAVDETDGNGFGEAAGDGRMCMA